MLLMLLLFLLLKFFLLLLLLLFLLLLFPLQLLFLLLLLLLFLLLLLLIVSSTFQSDIDINSGEVGQAVTQIGRDSAEKDANRAWIRVRALLEYWPLTDNSAPAHTAAHISTY